MFQSVRVSRLCKKKLAENLLFLLVGFVLKLYQVFNREEVFQFNSLNAKSFQIKDNDIKTRKIILDLIYEQTQFIYKLKFQL